MKTKITKNMNTCSDLQPSDDTGFGWVSTNKRVSNRVTVINRTLLECPVPASSWWYNNDTTIGQTHAYSIRLTKDGTKYSQKIFYVIKCLSCPLINVRRPSYFYILLAQHQLFNVKLNFKDYN